MVITYPLMTVLDDSGAIVTGATVTIGSVTDKAGSAVASPGATVNLAGANVSVDYDAEAKGEAWVTLAISKVSHTFTGLNAAPAFYLAKDSSRLLRLAINSGGSVDIAVQGTTVKAGNGAVTSATSAGIVLDSTDPLATKNLKGWSVMFDSIGRIGVITGTGTTTTKAVAGGWSDGGTPQGGDVYRLEGPKTVAPGGMDAIAGLDGWSLPQLVRALAIPLLGKRTGVPAEGAGGTITFTDNSGASLGTMTVDTGGNLTSINLLPPA